MANSERYWKLVNKLIDKGITSEDAWYYADPAEFMHYQSRNEKGFRVRRILRDVMRHMSWTKTLYDYVIRNSMIDDIRPNPVYNLLVDNGYNPNVVGTVLSRWSGLISKRNTLWISGDSESGAFQLGMGIAYCAPLAGKANFRDKTNPFEGCQGKTLIVWEGGHVQLSNVVLCQQVFSGTSAGTEHGFYKTPVLVINNNDMGEVFDGHKAVYEFRDKLYDTMYRLHLSKPFKGVIGCDDVKDFITWGCDNKVEVEDCHELK
ncbi:Rep protein [Southern Psittacara leucophthalmus aviadenovirus]|uniref:Rep protein n=1 Tax=Southern Psittacara leucophthalmus aviadenovirus TaxID=2604330 RepID=A0AAF1DB79_9ADEN|nr:Rep protein [Southern Psittacara leucophthalmus aviadenovirus]QEJ80762.1 Rep protein [Southern Psittacara leucophthalmus aviadenovirus]